MTGYRQITLQKDDLVWIERVYHELKVLNGEYPNFYDWYYNKVVKALDNQSRSIFVVAEGTDIAGVLIAKDYFEKKICTLRVSPQYCHRGIGKLLFEKSFELLNTDKPIITVSEEHVFEFNKLLKYFNFSKEKIYLNYYRRGKAEISYNGFLNKEAFEKAINKKAADF